MFENKSFSLVHKLLNSRRKNLIPLLPVNADRGGFATLGNDSSWPLEAMSVLVGLNFMRPLSGYGLKKPRGLHGPNPSLDFIAL